MELLSVLEKTTDCRNFKKVLLSVLKKTKDCRNFKKVHGPLLSVLEKLRTVETQKSTQAIVERFKEN
jgi:hypothetical protein